MLFGEGTRKWERRGGEQLLEPGSSWRAFAAVEAGSTMVARCLRCHKMYAEEGGGGCYYHPGTHRGDSHYGRTGLMCGWSCCKVLPPTLIP